MISRLKHRCKSSNKCFSRKYQLFGDIYLFRGEYFHFWASKKLSRTPVKNVTLGGAKLFIYIKLIFTPASLAVKLGADIRGDE